MSDIVEDLLDQIDDLEARIESMERERMPMWRNPKFWLFIAAAAFVMYWVGQANAHSAPSGMMYSGWCCNENDCAPIRHEDVTEHPDGSITFRHCRFTEGLYRPDGTSKGYGDEGMIRDSEDGEWHACILPDADQGHLYSGGPYLNNGSCRCIYRPLRGF